MQLGRTIARTVAPVALAAFVATGCSAGTAFKFGGIPEDSFCTVDGVGLKKAAFSDLISSAKQQYKDNGREFPKKDSEEYKQLSSQAVEFLIQQRLTEKQAQSFGITVSDKEIDKGIKELKEQYFDKDQKKFEAELKRSGYTEERVREDIRNKELSEKLFKRITSDIKISDKEAKEYYNDNKEQFETPESREVAHILVKKKALADEIYSQVKGGDKSTFSKLAKKHSEDPGSKETGGELPGGIQRGQTVPEFDKKAFQLKTGEISTPVKTTYGYHIIVARGDIKPASKQPFKSVKEQIKGQLTGQKETERFQEWQDDVRSEAEKRVKCRDGYVWSQTVTETAPEEGEEAVETEIAPEDVADDDKKSDEESDKKADKKESDKKDDKKSKK